MSRHSNPFIVAYLLFKGFLLGVIMKYFHQNMNLFKLFMLICYLTNMKIVFSRIIQLSERMKFGQLFSLRSTYFYLTFLAGNKWKKQTNDEHRLAAFYTEEI